MKKLFGIFLALLVMAIPASAQNHGGPRAAECVA